MSQQTWRYKWSMTVTWPDGSFRPAKGVLTRTQPGTHQEIREVLFAGLTANHPPGAVVTACSIQQVL